MMWFEVLQRIRDKLNESGLSISAKLGALIPQHAEISGAGTIMLVRGSETKNDESMQDELLMTFYLEAWVRDDEAEFESGYSLLAGLEERIEVVLGSIRNSVGALKEDVCVLNCGYQILDICVKQKVGDLDSMRPLLGTQYTIEVRLFNLNQNEGGVY